MKRQYILPRMPKPYSKRAQSSTSVKPTSTSSATLTITLKPLRASATGPNTVVVKDQTPESSIYDVKAACAAQAGYATEKVKILWERKPVSDSKTVKEVVGEDATPGAEVEMGVMFMGQPTQAPSGGSAEPSAAPTAEEQGPDRRASVYEDASSAQAGHGEAVLETKEFWDELQSFVSQKLHNDSLTTNVMQGFRQSWHPSTS